MPMQPSPMAETSKLLFPSFRFFISFSSCNEPKFLWLCDLLIFLPGSAIELGKTIGHRPSGCSRDRAAPVVFLRKSGALFYALEGVAELRGRHAHGPPKYLSEIAWISVADFERDFD